MRADNRRRDAALIAGVFVLILSFIWGWQEGFRGATVVFTIVLIGALACSHADLGGSLRDAGFRLDTTVRAAAILAPAASVIIALALLAGYMLGSINFPPPSEAWASLSEAFAFGLAQQYVLLGFFYNRFERLLGRTTLAVGATGLVFAIFHLPNPFLTVVTFFAGLLAVAVYQRAPNLWVSGLAHGLISYHLHHALPIEITGGLRVGP